MHIGRGDELDSAEQLQGRYTSTVRAIHESPTKAVVYATGGASQVGRMIFTNSYQQRHHSLRTRKLN